MLQDQGLSSPPSLLERVLELKETHCSPYLLAFLFDCYEDILENSNKKENMLEEDRKETLRKALDVSEGNTDYVMTDNGMYVFVALKLCQLSFRPILCLLS